MPRYILRQTTTRQAASHHAKDTPVTTPLPDDPDPKTLLVPFDRGCEILGCSRATGYRLLARGLIDARKIGSATKLTMESLRRYAASLPDARTTRPAA